jgi:NAD(P)H-hydrate epimerase
MVLDADALNLLATHPEWWKLLPSETVLTPHPKEADRLLRSAYQAGLLHGTVSASPEAMKLQSSYLRLERMRALAREARVIVVLKGAYTAVLLPSGEAWVNTEHGHAGMAVGGTGDTLTGILLALLAAQYPPRDAALLGVYLHSAAADAALAHVGAMESWLPGDLIDALGEAFREVSHPIENTTF